MKTRTLIGLALATPIAAAALAGWLGARGTEADIAAHHQRVAQAASQHPGPASADLGALPAPVQRYLRYVFDGSVPALDHVDMHMQGDFRRPGSEGFAPTSARQTVAMAEPAMMFDATTPMLPGIWARAYDAYVDGQMEMKAKILSSLTVVDEHSSPALDRISLRRWLLESPTYPIALLPGGPVRWQAVDDHSARATASHRGISATMLARFAPDGRLLSLEAEQDGDLNTPYHGSGEHVARSDYQRVQGMRIPLRFTISRAAQGKLYPFWDGRITHIQFTRKSAERVAALTNACSRRGPRCSN